MYEKYGPIVYERIGSQKPIIHVFEPEDVEIVYRNEDKMPKIFPLSNFTKMYRKKEGLSMGLGNTYVFESFFIFFVFPKFNVIAFNVKATTKIGID